MPSPDQSTYSSLVLYDKSAYDIIQQALLDASVKLGNFAPKVGTLEMALLESLALQVSEMIFAINRLPDGVMEVLMGNFGIVRLLGAPPQAQILITAVDTVGYAIPAGLQFRLDDGGGNSIVFLSDSPTAIAPGSLSVSVNATATTNTDLFNANPIGTSVAVISPTTFINFAQLNSVVSGGAGPETDDAWRSRVVSLLQSLSSVLVLADHFTNFALDDPSVYRAFTKDNYNVTTSAEGHVTVAVADSSGDALSTPAKTSLQDAMQARALASLTVHVVDPNFNEIDVTVAVTSKPGFSTTVVQASITDALNNYLSPITWQWDATVRINELISLVDQVTGVDYVQENGITAAIHGNSLDVIDVPLVGPFPLVTPGTISVSVTAPS